MGHFTQTIFVITPLLMAAIGCQKTPSETTQSASSFQVSPDLTMEKMFLQNFGEQGLVWELRAPVAQGYTKLNKMIAEQITVTLYKAQQKSTTIQADQGVFNSAEDRPDQPVGVSFTEDGKILESGDMYLKGHVVAISTQGHTMMTDWAHFKRQKNIIVSTAPVRVIRDDSETTGSGFEASSDMSRIKIFNQRILIKQSTTTR